MNTAELVSTGHELLSGRTLNRHGQTLGDALRAVGGRLVRDTTIGDDRETIADAVGQAFTRTDTVFVSGGLGPTSDDITRDALADLLGRSILPDPEALALLRDRYQKRGLPLGTESERQALVLEGAVVLSNPVGAAPGQRIDLEEGRVLFVLPGPPREFNAILETHVLPWLRERWGETSGLEQVFLLGGYPESQAARLFEQAGIPAAGSGVEIGYCASPGVLEVRLTASSARREAWTEAAARARDLLGDAVYAEQRIPLESAVLQRLFRKGKNLATAEGASLGGLARRMGESENAPHAYAGGVVAVHPGVLIDELAVLPEWVEEHGSASEPVARHMASSVRLKFGASIGCAVSPVAVQEGTSDSTPEGRVYIAIDLDGEIRCEPYTVTGSRSGMAEWSTQAALNRLWRALLP